MSEEPEFSSSLSISTSTETGDAWFGVDVLTHLVDGLAEVVGEQRTASYWGPGVLGCAMWMDDPALLAVLHETANCCVMVTKQDRKRYEKPSGQALAKLASATGLLQGAFPELGELAPHSDGVPRVIGPYDPSFEDNLLGGVREVGYRRVGDHLVPILHAKVMLVGDMWWSDDHPSGYAIDMYGFRPRRLWIGSANFTRSSRSSLEMGLWTSDTSLLEASRDWLLRLISISEPFGVGADVMEPELAAVDYDDAAFREYLGDLSLDDDCSF